MKHLSLIRQPRRFYAVPQRAWHLPAAASLFGAIVLFATLPVGADDAAAAASRDPAVVLPRLARFTPALGFPYIREVLGEPDMDVGGAN